MNSIKDIQDEKIRRLAETLKQSGLAASETEAIRMASDMTNTGNKVSQSFDEKKDQNVMGLSHLNKRESLAEAAEEPAALAEEPADEALPKEPAPQAEVAENEEVIEQELAGEPSEEEPVEEPQTEEKPELHTPERAPPKKDISEMAESKIDLSKVFDSSK